ncbi:MAG: transporter substrate-binding domain-containing protein [Proteobacteria bacterium]|nr:transporter substrate-binding domain-containing protein [Pseudomonadota bacterium]
MLRRVAMRVGRLLIWLMLLAASIAAGHRACAARPPLTPDAALQSILSAARAAAATSCADPADQLVRILCAGTIRVGVRDDYPPFAAAAAGGRSGFEVAVATRIAAALGVSPTFVTVTPADRIALLAENRIDLAIATMGDTTLRDGQARFIRPHYYASHTAIVGPRAIPLRTLRSLAGHTLCVTVGDSSNPELAAAGVRLLLFAAPAQLIDELHAGACSLIAQDDTFFARYFAKPRFSAEYETKFTMDPLPWGMAVARSGGDQLATALSLISEIFHRDGVFLRLAERNGVAPAFLREQRAVWQRPTCDTAQGFANPACVLPPRQSDMARTRFAGTVAAAEAFIAAHLGLHLSLAIFKLQPAWDLVRQGILNSIILIVGTLAATLGFALVIGRALGARRRVLRWPVRLLVMLLQSTPPVLSLVIAASAANAIFAFSAALALGAAILSLGLINGGNAGQAIAEAMATLRAEEAHRPAGRPALSDDVLYVHALRRSLTQIIAFLINATKATPMASFIGAPELLNALTDSTSFSSDRETTYWLLLIFYVVAVLLVVRLCGVMRGVLERRIAAS